MTNDIDARSASALRREAVSTVTFDMLGSAEGISLDLGKGNDHAFVLFPAMCCSHCGGRAVQQVDDPAELHDGPIRPMFVLSEHASTVSGCKLKLADGKEVDASTVLLPAMNDVALTYGQLIALSGDFYGDPNQPVCTATNKEDQFQKNFDSIRDRSTEVKEILRIGQKYEFEPVEKRVKDGRSPSGVFAAIPMEKVPGLGIPIVSQEDYEFMKATGLNLVALPPQFGRYTDLAASNFDHFGEDAMTCYNAGHILAQKKAIKAKQDGKLDALKLAYAINAFADHFLTDLFAGGHMRTPRRMLHEYPKLPTHVAGLLAKRMHDEDNKFGLWVENARGNRWVAYGDARYRDRGNTANRIMIKKALQQSIDDVWKAFDTGTVVSSDEDSEVFKYLPKVIKEIGHSSTALQHRDDRRNWAPLFFFNPNDKWIYARGGWWGLEKGSWKDIANRDYDWKPGPTLCLYATGVFDPGPYMPEGQYKAANIKYRPDETGDLGQVGWPADDKIMNVRGPDLDSLKPEDWCIDSTPGFDRNL